MSDINLIINRRKFLRAQITKIYNTRLSFDTLTVVEQFAKKSTLESYSDEIRKIDLEIQSLRADDSSFSEEQMFREFEVCSDYQDKIHICLAGLNLVVRSQQQQPVISHTGLKRPTAPLPRFKGEDG